MPNTPDPKPLPLASLELSLDHVKATMAEYEQMLLDSYPGIEQKLGREMALALLTSRDTGEVFGFRIRVSDYVRKDDILMISPDGSGGTTITRFQNRPFDIPMIDPPKPE